MIVNKSIANIKIGRQSHKLTVGQKVPKNILDYWKKTKQLKELLEKEIIKDDKKKVNDSIRSDSN